MAIQTAGFGVRQMPVYTPPNPSLVAFNPTAVSDGMMQAFQLAKQYEEIKSKKALQAELEATRQARIAQQNALAEFEVARANTNTPLLSQEAALRSGQIGNSLALLEPELHAKRTGLEFDTAKNQAFMPNLGLMAESEAKKTQAGLRSLEPITDATIDRARAESEQAKIDAGTASKRGQLTDKKLDLDLAEVSDRMLNAKSDNDRARAAKDIDTLLKNSQIIENLGRADYYAAGGGRSGGAKPNVANQIAALQLAKQRLETAPYTLPSGDQVKGLAAYKGATRDDSGKKRTAGTFLGFGTPRPIREDPNAEDAIKTSERLDKAINSLLPHLITEISGGPVPNEPAEVDVSKIPQAHINYLKANPKFKGDFDAKYGSGAADKILK